MSRSIALLLFLPMLAGCTEGDPAVPTSAECLEQGKVLEQGACAESPFEIRDFEDPGHHCVVTEQRERVHAPDLVGNPWALGQYWKYSLAVDGQELEPTQLVYYEDQDLDNEGIPQHYMVGTTTREEALRKAVYGENPMVGRVHRILYSPHESGDHADMFHFPLCDGSSWTTMFYGERFTLTAAQSQIALPTGSDEGFIISGQAPSGSTLALSYSPRAQWFTFIDLQRADGASVGMDLIEMGTGYSGPVHFLRGQQEEAVHINGSAAVPFVAQTLDEVALYREDGAEGAYDTLGLSVQAHLTGSGTALLELLGPGGQVAWNRTLGSHERLDALTEVPYAEGEWTVRLRGVALDQDGAELEARLNVVSIYDRSGSL